MVVFGIKNPVQLAAAGSHRPSHGTLAHLSFLHGLLQLPGQDTLVDPDLLAEAFYLYEWNRQFDQIDREINRFVYSEVFYLPERLDTAIAISERIKEQLLAWASVAIPQFEAFLARRQASTQ